MLYIVLIVWRIQKPNLFPLNSYFKQVNSWWLNIVTVKKTVKTPKKLNDVVDMISTEATITAKSPDVAGIQVE